MSESFNRRDFLARASALPLGGAAVVGVAATGRPADAQTPIKRAGGSKLKTSLNAYSFSKPLNDQLKKRAQGMSYFDLLDFCAAMRNDAPVVPSRPGRPSQGARVVVEGLM